MGSQNKGIVNKYGMLHSEEHKVKRLRANALIKEGVDATYGVALNHPDGLGYFEVSGIAGSAGCYALSNGISLYPDMFEPGEKFGFRLSRPLKHLEVSPEGMLSGWLVTVDPIRETQ